MTVTGAPKPWAIKFVEEHEETPRCWCGVVTLTLALSFNRTLTYITLRSALGPHPSPSNLTLTP